MSHDSNMHETYDNLSRDLATTITNLPLGQQHWIGIAGGPGAGKSTLAAEVCTRINYKCKGEIAVVLPMDGFHYSRATLREMGNRVGGSSFEELIARRGAPWTFDAESLCQALKTAKQQGYGELPTYSRTLSDPVEGGVKLLPTHRIVLVEGNYLLNWDDPAWAPLQDIFDEKWFISCNDMESQRQRLIKRHLETWTEEKTRLFGAGEIGAANKADSNDVINARFVDTHKQYADRLIISL
eukprot:gene9688-20140_t